MGKKYRVVVNGEVFEVEIDEMGAGQGTGAFSPTVRSVQAAPEVPPAPTAPAPAAPAAPPAPKAAPAPGSDGGKGYSVLSPLPGKVLRYAVSEGQRVKQGDLLLMIEAMKMENELFSAESGVVRRLYPAVGQNVETGERLIDIEIGG